MCEAGRIRHRLKRWIWSDAATVLLAGYQAAGTLGRILLDGARSIRIQGEDLSKSAPASARSTSIPGMPTGRNWRHGCAARAPVRQALFLTHGEPPAMEALATALRGRLSAPVICPALDEGFDLGVQGAQAVGAAPLPAQPRLAPEAIAAPTGTTTSRRCCSTSTKPCARRRTHAAAACCCVACAAHWPRIRRRADAQWCEGASPRAPRQRGARPPLDTPWIFGEQRGKAAPFFALQISSGG